MVVVVYKQLLCMLVEVVEQKQLLVVPAADTRLLVVEDTQHQVVGHRRHRAAVVDKGHQALTDTSLRLVVEGRLLQVVADGHMRYRAVVVVVA